MLNHCVTVTIPSKDRHGFQIAEHIGRSVGLKFRNDLIGIAGGFTLTAGHGFWGTMEKQVAVVTCYVKDDSDILDIKQLVADLAVSLNQEAMFMSVDGKGYLLTGNDGQQPQAAE